MIRSLVIAGVVLGMLVGSAHALTPHQVVRQIVLDAQRDTLPGATARADMPEAARLAMYAGADATVALLDLGDKSPLKKSLPAQAWGALVSQYPRLSQAAVEMREALIGETLAAIEKHELSMPRLAGLTAGGMLLAASRVDDLLEKATLIYSARAILVLGRETRIARKLAIMAIDPRVPAEVRKEAGVAIAVATGVEVQEALAEANLLKLLDGGR